MLLEEGLLICGITAVFGGVLSSLVIFIGKIFGFPLIISPFQVMTAVILSMILIFSINIGASFRLIRTEPATAHCTFSGDKFCYDNEAGCYNNYQQGKNRAIVEHYGEGCQYCYSTGKKLGESLRYKLAESISVVGVMAHYVAVGVCVKIFYRK